MKYLPIIAILILPIFYCIKWLIGWLVPSDRFASISSDPKLFRTIIKDKSKKVYLKRKLISKIINVQSSEQFINQTKLSQTIKDESYSRVPLVNLSEKIPSFCSGIKRKYSAMIKDMRLLPEGGNEILYCAFVKFEGEYFRYVGITTDFIEKRWGFKYPSSHFVQCHATRCGSVAKMEQGYFSSYVKTRDYRYLLMGMVDPEDIIVLYKKFNARQFVNSLFDYLDLDIDISDEICIEIPEFMIINKYRTDSELNEKSSIGAMSDHNEKIFSTNFSQFLSK